MDWMKITSKIFSIVLIATALLLVVSVLPIPGGIKSYVVLSGSMEPAIRTGSVVFIIPQKQYKIGDIVTFGQATKTQAPTTHRIVDTKFINGAQAFITKGDANNANDQRDVPATEIQGLVFLTIPLMGYVINFARNPIVFISIIALCAILIIVDQAKSIMAEMKKEKTEKSSTKEEQK